MTSDERYEELAGRDREPGTLVEFFRESPFVGSNSISRGRKTKDAKLTYRAEQR